MAQEAAVTLVMKMRDEASPKMANLGQTVQKTNMNMDQFKMTLTAVGSAMTAVGSLLNQIDNPTAKAAANFFMISGAVMTTTSAIMQMMPAIRGLITMLRGLAAIQAVVAALSGPAGWASLAVAAAVGAGVYFGASGIAGGKPAPAATTVNIKGGPLLMTDDAGMQQFSRRITEAQNQDKAVGR